MLGRILLITSAVAVLLLAVVFHTTTPSEIGPVGILSVFVLLYTLSLAVVTFLIFGVGYFFRKVVNIFIAAKRPMQPLSLMRSYYFASVISLAPIMLLGIHSVGELGFYDVFLVVIFAVVASVYVAKRTQ